MKMIPGGATYKSYYSQSYRQADKTETIVQKACRTIYRHGSPLLTDTVRCPIIS